MRTEFLTDRFDEYISGGCPQCASGCAYLTLDTVTYYQFVKCAACHTETPYSMRHTLDDHAMLELLANGTAQEAFSAIQTLHRLQNESAYEYTVRLRSERNV